MTTFALKCGVIHLGFKVRIVFFVLCKLKDHICTTIQDTTLYVRPCKSNVHFKLANVHYMYMVAAKVAQIGFVTLKVANFTNQNGQFYLPNYLKPQRLKFYCDELVICHSIWPFCWVRWATLLLHHFELLVLVTSIWNQ